jgi:DNA-binding IclR family transcriptional regulator
MLVDERRKGYRSMSTTEEFRRIADAIMAACGPVEGEHRYVGAVAPELGVPLVDVQRILDKMERLGLLECTTQNPLQCRLTKWGVGQLERQARRDAAKAIPPTE